MAERVSVIGRVMAICGAAMMAVPVIAQEPVRRSAAREPGPVRRSAQREPGPVRRSAQREPGPVRRSAQREGGWFSAWAAAHNVGLGVQGLSGGSVRLIVRPTLSGPALRVKLTNIRGNTPAVFSAAYIGVSGDGASVIAGT